MEQTREAFGEMVSPGSGALLGELDYGALLIAASVDPTTDVAAEVERLDQLADSIAAPTLAALTEALFGGSSPDPARHFRGNQSAYYDLANSLLPRVLDRHIGIPITLSVILIEIGRRLGYKLHGVGMPGHFLVGTGGEFIDPFHGGAIYDQIGCQEVFQRLIGQPVPLPEDALEPTPPAQILLRILNNLSAIATNTGDRRTLRAVRSLLAAFPEADHRDHVQHAYAAAGIGHYGEAAVAAERALVSIPDQVRPRIESQIVTWRARLN